jgi:monomeric sarcosine oxidase
MSGDDPVVIVGAGLMGAAAAWSLRRRDVPVVVVEQFAVGHPWGSSHGSARIIRRAYGDPFYVSLTGRVFEMWREVAAASGSTLLRMLGGLDFGPGRDAGSIAARLAEAGVTHEVLTAGAASQRWPGMRFEGDVVFHPQAGTLDAQAAVAALLDLATAAGAQIRVSTEVVSVGPAGVRLGDGSWIPARCVVVAAGGWVARLLDGVVALPPMRVSEQSVFHFPRREPAAPPWPSVIHEGRDSAVYHLAGGRDGGVADDRKLGRHDAGPAWPGGGGGGSGGGGAVDPAARERVIDYVRRWLPGLEPTPRGETTCLYTSTPSEDFLLDRVDDVVVCSSCSGHGAKFAPLIGEYVADLVTDAGDVPARFRLAAHRSGRTGSVSL